MKEQPLVTVLLPCYNAQSYLKEALDSIVSQTYLNLEILCINDGSDDATSIILDEYAERDGRFVVVNNEVNLKLIKTLNKGVKLAKGKYIARMDADDISFPKRIETCLEFLENNPKVDLVSPLVVNIDENGNEIGQQILRNRGRVSSLFASFFYSSIGHPEIMCKTSLLIDNPYSLEDDVLHTEDYELWSRLLIQGYNLQVIPEVLLFLRYNTQSVSRLYNDLQNINFVKQSNKICIKYFKECIPLTISAVLANRINDKLSVKIFLLSIIQLKKYKRIFIKKESPLSEKEINEIELVYWTHKFDIFFQAIKKGRFSVKVIVLPLLLFHFALVFFDSKRIAYIKNKRSVNIKKGR